MEYSDVLSPLSPSKKYNIPIILLKLTNLFLISWSKIIHTKHSV